MTQQNLVEIRTWEELFELSDAAIPSMEHKMALKEENLETVIIFSAGISAEVYFQDAFMVSGLLPQFEVTTKNVNGTQNGNDVVLSIPVVTLELEEINEVLESLSRFVPSANARFQNRKFEIEQSFEGPSQELALENAEEVRTTTEDEYQLVGFYLQDSLGILLVEKNSGDIVTHKTNFAGIFTFAKRYNVSEIYLFLGKAWEQEALQQVLDLQHLPHVNTVDIISVQYFLVRDELHAFREEHFGRNSYSYVEVCAFYYYTKQVAQGNVHGSQIRQFDPRNTLVLNDGAFNALDIFDTNAGLTTKKEGTIYGLLDRCITQQGSRLVKKLLQEPLVNPNDLIARYEAVGYFLTRSVSVEKLTETLSESKDVERLFEKWTKSRLKEDEVIDMFETLEKYQVFLEVLAEVTADHNIDNLQWLTNANANFTERLSDELERLSKIISPIDVITEGFFEDFDVVRVEVDKVQNKINELLIAQIEATGIKNLKISKNENVGVHFEVTKTGWKKVPDNWTLLSEIGNKRAYQINELIILGRELSVLQGDYDSLHRKASAAASSEITSVETLKDIFDFIAFMDMILSFASVSAEFGYVRPRLVDNVGIQIKNGRHALMQGFLKRNVIENDFELLNGNVISLFGGNTSGKSTYLKMIATNILLAQVGCFVPASSMAFSPVDQIFMRTDKHDIVLKGKSSFLVEMEELSYVLHHATPNSLILLDEIGSATNPLEGSAIAISTVEYIAQHLGAKAVCSTHYENVSQLATTNENIHNFHMEVYQSEGRLRSTYRVKAGESLEVKGFEVAEMSHLPVELMDNLKARLGRD